MTIAVTGLSHHTSPLALRERMAVSADDIPDALSLLRSKLGPESGVALLATCNRIEIYVCAKSVPETLHQEMTTFLASLHRLAESEFSGFLYHKANADAVTHLFRVAASLDSMVVGENEILAQIQQAYDIARKTRTLNRVLNTLLQRALRCGKKVRSETSISKGKVSVASVAVDLAESILKDLSGKTAMIVGSGQISELALKSLIERGVRSVMVLNRTLERARTLAKTYQGEALILKALPCHLHRADIVISSTGAQELILKAGDFERAIEKRGRAPMFVIDIAVPRDIELEAAHVDNVYCYDMDDLQGVAHRNLAKRQGEINACMEIVQREVASFVDWRHRLHAEPLIVALTKSYQDLRERELQRTLKKLPHIADTERHELECLARRLTNTLLRKPITALKAASTAEQEQMLDLIERFFNISDRESL